MTNIKMLILLFMVGSYCAPALAWLGMPTPPLHVEGRYLKDPDGNHVVLRGGWMQPTESWFNGGGRWYRNPTDWTDPNNIAGMLNYLNEAANVMSDTTPKYGRDHGWYCSFVRMNTDAVGGWTQQAGLVNQEQFDGWIHNFLVPYLNHLRSRGLYLILSATGPVNTPNNDTRNAGVTEQARLRTFWQTVANAPGIKNADNIMFELMNEPVEIESAPGNGDWGMGEAKYFRAFRDWIQPVIDDIRSTGANNIIWVPTLEWQGSPQQHVQFPFTGTNCGIAVHYYPAYGACYDNVNCHNNLWNNNYKPASDRWPLLITENFWFPEDNGLCTGSTANYGNTLRNNMRKEGNISYMIGFLSDLLGNLNDARPTTAALSQREGSQAAFPWFYEDNRRFPQAPYGGTPHPIPGIIQAEQFDNGGNGYAYYDTSPGSATGVDYRTDEDVDIELCTDAGGGYNIGWATAGEWLKYTVDVQREGNYDLNLRIACLGGGRTMTVSMDGTPIAADVPIPNTSGWQTWTTTTVQNIPLKAGRQVMRLTIGPIDHININYVEFVPSVITSSEKHHLSDVKLYPNPFTNEGMQISKPGKFIYRITDMSGAVLESGVGNDILSVGRELSPGLFLLQIGVDEQSTVQKIIKY